jgi:hypothetical protein
VLANILDSISLSDFRTEYAGKQFFHAVGERSRFTHLLPWAELNAILRHHRLDVPRLRLIKEGKALPAPSFIQYSPSRRPPYNVVPRLRAADLTAHLRSGATLVIDSVDELHEPVTQLAQSIEAGLGSRIQVNMYAGWRKSHGFDLHWDDHDVFILQVSGRKHWKVYPFTREHPLPKDSAHKGSPPQESIWEGTLEEGQVLYIPRGWWHVAIPLDEPTLHLTVGVHNRKGVDLLSWFQDRLTEDASVRQDLPRHASSFDKAVYMERLQNAFSARWKPELLDEYFAYIDARAPIRATFSLPFSATPEILPASQEAYELQWLPAQHLDFEPKTNETIEFLFSKKTWRFAAAAKPLLDYLQATRRCSLTALQQASSPAIAPAVVERFVRELVVAGLLAVRTLEEAG